MMISVCIPVYNFDVRPLVEALGKQLDGMELVIIDDASSDAFREINREVCAHYVYHELDRNVGRARIRNLFPEHSSHDYLLFLDCDSLVISDDFLAVYRDLASEGVHRVVCGGRVYPELRPGRSRLLRWKYGHERESQPADKRKRDPNRSFMTNNFMVHRSILEKHPFDEELLNYGHEDTLFGFRLKQEGIPVHHIDNPVLNGHLEQNLEFLEKTRQGVENLLEILNRVDDPVDFSNDIMLLKAYAVLNEKHLSGFISFLFRITQPLTVFLLSRGLASIRLFDSYKLGILVLRSRGKNTS